MSALRVLAKLGWLSPARISQTGGALAPPEDTELDTTFWKVVEREFRVAKRELEYLGCEIGLLVTVFTKWSGNLTISPSACQT